MLVQRAHGAENGAKNRLANGPLRVQSNDRGDDILLAAVRVFCNVRMCVNHQGYDSILLSAQHKAVNQGGTADNLFVLDRF